MNRITEFKSMITRTNISQIINRKKIINPFIEKTNQIETEFDKLKSKETHNSIRSLKNYVSILESLKTTKEDVIIENEDEMRIFNDIEEIKRMKIYTLKQKYINKIKDLTAEQNKTAVIEEILTHENNSQIERIPKKPSEPKKSQETTFQESKVKKRDNIYEKVESQLTEVTQMMDEVSMQVKMQGEKLQRIDSLGESAKGYVKDGFFDINRKWNNISGRRRLIYKFYIFWYTVIFIIFLFKKFL